MNANVMTAAELVRYNVRNSLGLTASFGAAADFTPRASMIGRKDQRAVGGRDAVIAACRTLPGLIGEETRSDGYVEFHGATAIDNSIWRVVVI